MAMTIEGLLLKIRQRRLAVILFPVLVGLYLGLLFIARPMKIKLAQIEDERALLTEKSSVLENLRAVENTLSAQRARLAEIEDRTKLIEALNVIASRSGLTISSVTPQEKINLGSYLQKLQVRIEAEGNFHQLGEFVSSVESLDQVAKVLYASIDLESGENVILTTRLGLNPSGSIKSGLLRSYKMSIDIGFFAAQKGAL